MTSPIFEYSAGGVVVSDETVLVIYVQDLRGQRVWTFPKGQLQKGESSREAALREVQEETGWRCRVEAKLPQSEYWFQREGRRIKKTVQWFLMVPEERAGEHDEEVEDVLWLSFPEALARLTYKDDRALLEQAMAIGVRKA